MSGLSAEPGPGYDAERQGTLIELAADQRDATLIAACIHAAVVAESMPGSPFRTKAAVVDAYARELYALVTATPWESGRG